MRLISAFEIPKGSEVDIDPITGCKSTEDLVSSPKRFTVVFQARDEEKFGEELL